MLWYLRVDDPLRSTIIFWVDAVDNHYDNGLDDSIEIKIWYTYLWDKRKQPSSAEGISFVEPVLIGNLTSITSIDPSTFE